MWTYERLFAEASTILSSKDGFSLDSLSNQSKHVPKRAKRAKRIQKQKTQEKCVAEPNALCVNIKAVRYFNDTSSHYYAKKSASTTPSPLIFGTCTPFSPFFHSNSSINQLGAKTLE